MSIFKPRPLMAGLFFLAACSSAATAPETGAPPAAAGGQAAQPNFVIIVTDDLGFSDLGAFGGEIATPNLDALALRGIRLTGFHTAPTCSPTRSMLLSGTTNHFAGLGTMAEMIAPNQKGQPNHEGYLREDIAALPEILSANGYDTILSGKWHLGLTPEQDPSARGFNRSFTLLQGGHNHFGGDAVPGADAIGGATYRLNGQTLSELPADFYSSDTFTDYLINFVRESQDGQADEKPFLALLTFTAPHWPLHALPEDIAKYSGRYDAGFEALRDERLARQKELGLLTGDVEAHPLVLREGAGWADLSAEQKAIAARDMEVYAAMVDRVDQNVGRLVAALEEVGELDNTVFFFLSDNGAEGMDFDHLPLPILEQRIAQSDNSLENRGAQSSYTAYGPGWAQAATAPSWLYKAYGTEGGTRVVSFVTVPESPRAGQIENAFLTVSDILPTVLDLAGIAPHEGEFEGRTVRPILGKSWAGLLDGTADQVWADDEPFALQLFASRLVRKGPWKLTDPGDGTFRLFNIANDPGETTDLSAQHPDKLAELQKDWDAYAAEAGVIMPDNWRYRP